MNQLGKFDNDNDSPPLVVNEILIGSVPNTTAIAINERSNAMVIASNRIELWNGSPSSGYTLYTHVPGTAEFVDVYLFTVAVATSTLVSVYSLWMLPAQSYTFTAITGLGVQATRVLVSELGTVWSAKDGKVTSVATGGSTFGTSLSVGKTKYVVSEPGVNKIYVYDRLDILVNTFGGDTGFGTYLSMSRNDDYIVASGTSVFQNGDTSSIKARICDVSTNGYIDISASVEDAAASHRTEAVYASSTYIDIYAADRFFKFTLAGVVVSVHGNPGVLAAAASDRMLVSANPDLYMWIHEPLAVTELEIDAEGDWNLLEGQHQVRITTTSEVTITLPIKAVDGDIVYLRYEPTAVFTVVQETAPNNSVTIAAMYTNSRMMQLIFIAAMNKWYLAGVS